MKTPRKQLGGNKAEHLGAINFAFPAAPTATVTTAISTVLATAGENDLGVAVQLADVVSSTVLDPGLVVSGAGSKNLCHVWTNGTGLKLKDAFDNEVYGRLTDAAGVRTLSLYSYISGVETAFTPAAPVNIDFFFPYRIPWALFPTDVALGRPASTVQDDPSATITRQENVRERLLIVAPNTIPNLTETPDVVSNVFLIINKQTYDTFGGVGVAAFSVAGNVVTWNPTNTEAGFNLNPGDWVIADYTYEI